MNHSERAIIHHVVAHEVLRTGYRTLLQGSFLLLPLLWLALYSQQSNAQNVTLFGGNSVAKECYDLSQTAAMTSTATRMDVEVCDKAIHHGNLKKADLIATYVNRGILFTAMEDYVSAARDYNQALSMSDEVGEAYVNRGNLWFVASRFEEAISDYDKSLKYGIAKPHIALLNRGMAYEYMGKLDQALVNYDAALEKVAEWPVAIEKRARVQRKIDKQTTDKADKKVAI